MVHSQRNTGQAACTFGLFPTPFLLPIPSLFPSPFNEISKSNLVVLQDQLMLLDRVVDPSSYLVFIGPFVFPFQIKMGFHPSRCFINGNPIIQSGRLCRWLRLFPRAVIRSSLHCYDLISSKLKCEQRHQKQTATKTATK